MRYSSIWKRLLAMILDYCILGIINLYFFLIGLWYVPVAITMLYLIGFEASALQATPGKLILGIKVAYVNGHPIGIATSIIRTIGKLLSTAALLIGYIMAVFSEERQTLHDKIADTVVIENRSVAIATPTVQNQTDEVYLLGISGEFAGKRFAIKANGIVMGRDRVTCNIVFAEDSEGISRHHCMITFNKQTRLFILNDIGSTYGTYVEGVGPVHKGQSFFLKSGERFYLTNSNNMFETKA